MSRSSSSNSGIGFFGILTILFIALKLTHCINWSWFWVLFPAIIGPILFLTIILFGALAFLCAMVKDRSQRKKWKAKKAKEKAEWQALRDKHSS